MSEQKGTLQLIVEHLILALQPFQAAIKDVDSFYAFMLRLGWEPNSLPTSYTELGDKISAAWATLNELGETPTILDVRKLYQTLQEIYVMMRELEPPGNVDADQFVAETGERLFNVLVIDYLALTRPGFYNLFKSLGIVVLEHFDESSEGIVTRPAYLLSYFQFDQIPRLINQPALIPKGIYKWGTKEFDFPLLADHLQEILVCLDLPATIEYVDPEQAKDYQDEVGSEEIIDKQLVVPIAEVEINEALYQVGLALLEYSPADSRLPGVILQPFAPSNINDSYDLTDTLRLVISGQTNLTKTFGVVFTPDDLSVRYPTGDDALPLTAEIGLALEYHPPTTTVLLGEAQASRLQCAGMTAGFKLRYLDDKLEVSFEAIVHDLAVVLALGDQDGFIAKLFSGADVTIPIPLGVRWSNIDGFAFTGSANFVVSSYPHLAIGPVTIDAVQLAVRASLDSGERPTLALEAGVSFKGQLGVVSFAVEEVGVSLGCWFVQPKNDQSELEEDQSIVEAGNAGPFDVEVGYKAPKGVGLQLNSAAVTGGGYLHFDDENKQYAGIVSLVFEDFMTLTAIGLLTTRLPDGSDGFSLLIIITAEGFTPVQLGFGFTLQGIGGLLGVNRTAAVDVIRAGLSGHVLDAILFPENPVENANQYVSSLQSVFPPTEGRHVFGPMVIIGWGTPTILTLELAILLDLPSPLRLIAVGRIRALLPSVDAPLIKLQMNALGVVDFDLSEGSLDATLIDSTIAGFPVTGNMALRASWAVNPGFLLAIGGFHPHFQPPPNFPALARLAVNLADSAALRLRLEVYLALTSNTAQFGAYLDFYAEIAGFTVRGDFAFDTLFNFSPFEFRASVSGAIALAYDGEALMSVSFNAALSGPAPWHVNGNASFEFLGLTQIIDLLFELGSPPHLPAFPKIDLKGRLRDVLNDTRNWRGQLPADKSALVSFRAAPIAGAFVHPLGDLSLQQNLLPLKVDIEHFGNSTVEGDRYFQIVGVKSSSATGSTASISLSNTATSSLSDYFAPAHFFELDDAEQLSRPSFESMAAGFGFTAEAVALPGVAHSTATENVSREIGYATVIIDPNVTRRRTEDLSLTPLRSSAFANMVSYSAAAQSTARGSGKAKYRGATDNSVAVADTSYVIATVADLRAVAIAGIDPVTGAAYAEADDALEHYLLTAPDEAGLYQVAGIHEVGH